MLSIEFLKILLKLPEVFSIIYIHWFGWLWNNLTENMHRLAKRLHNLLKNNFLEQDLWIKIRNRYNFQAYALLPSMIEFWKALDILFDFFPVRYIKHFHVITKLNWSKSTGWRKFEEFWFLVWVDQSLCAIIWVHFLFKLKYFSFMFKYLPVRFCFFATTKNYVRL